MLHYILQTIVFQLLFLLAYEIFFKKETFFNWNRAYLLLTAALSVVLPFVKLQSVKTIMPSNFVIRLPEVIIGKNQLETETLNIVNESTRAAEPVFMWSWSYFVYVGMAIALLILVYKIVRLALLIDKNPRRWKGDVLIVKLLKSNAAFSFFYYIFLGENIKEEDQISILNHELVHVQQKHTWDLIFFEVLKIIFWFNPLIYIYQNRITALHEYIADFKAVKYQNKQDYYQNLLSQVFSTQQFSFVNSFYKQSLIKKRIIMLSKSKSKQIFLAKYLLLIPIVLGMLVYTSCNNDVTEDKSKVTIKSSKVENKNYDKNEVPFAVVEEIPLLPSCGTLPKEEQKRCVINQISNLINENFNLKIAEESGLTGEIRIIAFFRIDQNGIVTDVKARAQYPKLEEETKRVIKLLPAFIPGKQNGELVTVAYSLPILLVVNE